MRESQVKLKNIWGGRKGQRQRGRRDKYKDNVQQRDRYNYEEMVERVRKQRQMQYSSYKYIEKVARQVKLQRKISRKIKGGKRDR